MSLRIEGIGLAVPEQSITQANAAEMMVGLLHPGGGRETTVRALYKRSGIQTRHSVLLASGEPRQSFYRPAETSSDEGPSTARRMEVFEAAAPSLLHRAAEDALDQSDLRPGDVTHLITVSCTGVYSPGLDASLIETLGLSRSIERTHVGFMGCHGFLNGLRVARSFAESDPSARVLVGAVELCSLHMSYRWDPDAIVTNALFADGAAALVGSGAPRHDNDEQWRVAAQGTLLLPNSSDAMTWKVGDHGFRMTLSAGVPSLIESHVGKWLTEWLAGHDLRMEDIRSWAVHPGGPRVLTAFGASVGLDRSELTVSREILSEYGNMSSATLLFIIERLRSAGAETPCVAIAFGPGLVAEVALIL